MLASRVYSLTPQKIFAQAGLLSVFDIDTNVAIDVSISFTHNLLLLWSYKRMLLILQTTIILNIAEDQSIKILFNYELSIIIAFDIVIDITDQNLKHLWIISNST